MRDIGQDIRLVRPDVEGSDVESQRVRELDGAQPDGGGDVEHGLDVVLRDECQIEFLAGCELVWCCDTDDAGSGQTCQE